MLVSMFLLILILRLVGCVDIPNGHGTQDPYWEYDNEKFYSQ